MPPDPADQAEAELRAALLPLMRAMQGRDLLLDTLVPVGTWKADELAVYLAALELVQRREKMTLSEFVQASGRHLVVLNRDAAATDPNTPAGTRRAATLQ